MSVESPPTYTTSIFNQSNFNTTDGGLDTAYLNAHYLKYPTAQTGLETIANLATTNDATINGLTIGKGSGTGTDNTALGNGALKLATTASQNTAVGHEALYNTTTNGTQTAVGFHALRNATGSNNLAIGYRALRGTAGTNTGTYNVAIGEDSLLAITFGSYNTALGYRALYANATGDNNIAIGYGSLIANTGGGNNVAVGNNALSKLTVQSNSVGVGTNALFANTGSNNTAIGDAVLYGQVGSSTGSSNTGVGSGALSSITTGANNVAVGRNAGTSGTAITTGSNNTFVGYQAQADGNGYSNSTALGSGAVITASNQVVLGTTNETVVIPRITRFLSPPVYSRTNTTTQSIGNTSDVLVLFPSLVSGSSTYTGLTYSAGTFTNSNSYSIAVSITATLIFAVNTTGGRVAYILPSGLPRQGIVYTNATATYETCINISANFIMTAGSTFGVYVFQSSGGALNLTFTATAYSTVSIMVL